MRAPASWWPSTGLWRHPDFLRLWAAQAVSAFGSRITRTALPIIAVLTIGASPLQIAILSALEVLPGVIVGLTTGGWIDRRGKRPLLIGADLVRFVLVMTVPVAAWFGVLGMTQLYVVAAFIGAAGTLFQIADNAYLPALVGKPSLIEGNSKLEATDSVAEIGGPSLAGILIQVLTAPIAMVVDAFSYLWSAAMLARIRSVEVPAASGEAGQGVLEDILIGARAGLRDPIVRPTILATALSTFFGGFFFALYMPFALTTLSLDPATIGIVIGMGGVGALLGAVLSPWMIRRFGFGLAMLASLAAAQLGMLLIPMAAGAPIVVIGFLVAHQLLGDGFGVAWSIQSTTLRQTVLPLPVLGRVNALIHALRGALLPAGALVAGALAELMGIRAAVWIGVLGGLAAPLLLIRPDLLAMARLPEPR